MRSVSIVLVALGATLTSAVQDVDDAESVATPPLAPPEGLPLGLPVEPLVAIFELPPSQVELGRRLFFDGSLSSDRSISCASCHVPEHGFADPRPRSIGVAGTELERNAPSLFNRALGAAFMWDGSAASLEEQVLMPIENEREMGLGSEAAVRRLAQDESYATSFVEAFGRPADRDVLASALASFVRSQLYGDSPVDAFRDGEHDALTPQERSGLWLFESRGGCWRCHSGPNFTDEQFHNTGVGVGADEGRRRVTGLEGDTGAFKTPTLRGVALTPPYMHDGSLETLRDVVEFYRRGGEPNEHLDRDMKAIEMTDTEAQNLVAFLEALTRR